MKLPKRLRWMHVRRLYEVLEPLLKASPLKLAAPDRGRVLVLAPHIDDDVIGAGGSICKHVSAGDHVTTLYFADCTPERIGEAEEAAGVIGLRDLRFLDYSSKTLLDQKDLALRLEDVITECRPEIVYLPSLFDRHNDHLATNHLLMTLTEKNRYAFTICGYEVWSALIPNVTVDITDTAEQKREALSKYRSQLGSHDWPDAALSLNRYRGVTSGAGAYAEGFMRYSAAEYSEIWKKVYVR